MRLIIAGIAVLTCSLFTSSSAFAQAPVPPTAISFDGYCDGLSLSFHYGQVGGVLTGCYSGEGVAGGEVFTDSVSGGEEMQITSTVDPGCVLNYYFDIHARTWANFSTCYGSPQSLVNAGTFSYGQVKGHGPGSASRK